MALLTKVPRIKVNHIEHMVTAVAAADALAGMAARTDHAVSDCTASTAVSHRPHLQQQQQQQSI
jgi:ubiquinone biosynthesis protein UbiJ